MISRARRNKNHNACFVMFFTIILFVTSCIPNDKSTLATMRVINRRILNYARLNGQLPNSLDELKKIQNADNEIRDAWGNRIGYFVDLNGKVTLISLGKDGKVGGEGENRDISRSFDSRGPDGKFKDYADWNEF